MQTFDPAPGKGNFFSTRALNMDGKLQFNGGVMVNYGYDPLTLENCQSGPCTTIKAVENIVTTDVLASLTIIPQLQVGLKVPVTWLNGQGVTASGEPVPDGVNAFGLGDIQIEAKGRFYGKPGDVINLGGYVFGGIPMGNLTAEGQYIGNASASLGAGAVASGALREFSWAVNLGALVRESAQLANAEVGTQGVFRVGAGYQIGPMLKVLADVYGSSTFGDSGTNIEGLVGAALRPMSFPVSFTVGGGGALFKGLGAARARVVLGVLYSVESRDRDGDGINDDADACPTDPEDRDGFEDGDGCPDLDNDQDTIPDAQDKCPDKAEDFDGFEDQDGCPEPDNDKDGIPDVSDRCPGEPENMNGFLDEDGCPDEKDTDGDGIPDADDKCQSEPEDTDGFEDTDGCPDPDNDGDGIPDVEDECIDLAEDGVGEGRLAEDGCPVDTDEDGVVDINDQCPDAIEDLQGEGPQQRDGCPIDQTPGPDDEAIDLD